MNAIGLDLTTIAIVWLAGSVILIPLLIMAVRFAIVPLLEVISRSRSGLATSSPPDEARLSRIEEHLAQLARDIDRLTAVAAGRAS